MDPATHSSKTRLLTRFLPSLLLVMLTASFLLLSTQSGAAQDDGEGGMQATPDSWIILPTMPADATQADYGEQYYILVCQACHGDLGRGLTSEWLSQWHPKDQNCWQSKCHSLNHPPDGFVIPSYVPPVMGEDALLRFRTAFDLFNYIKTTMPYQAPDTMLEQEYWDVTAFLLRENNIGNLNQTLNAETAPNILLRPEQDAENNNASPSSQTATPLPELATEAAGGAPASRNLSLPALIAGGVVATLLIVILAWRILRSSR